MKKKIKLKSKRIMIDHSLESINLPDISRSITPVRNNEDSKIVSKKSYIHHNATPIMTKSPRRGVEPISRNISSNKNFITSKSHN